MRRLPALSPSMRPYRRSRPTMRKCSARASLSLAAPAAPVLSRSAGRHRPHRRVARHQRRWRRVAHRCDGDTARGADGSLVRQHVPLVAGGDIDCRGPCGAPSRDVRRRACPCRSGRRPILRVPSPSTPSWRSPARWSPYRSSSGLFVDYLQTAVGPEDVLVGIQVPARPGLGACYEFTGWRRPGRSGVSRPWYAGITARSPRRASA